MEARFFTDRGKVRSLNEDAGGIYYNSDNQPLLVVADGMGGHQAGDVASDMTITMIKEFWEKTTCIQKSDEIEGWLQATLSEVNHAIFEQAKNNEAYQGMGTTVVIGVCIDDFITIAHIGDSRCYLSNRKGLRQITEDHSLVRALIRSGQITEDDADHHPQKNVVLKALGTEANVYPDIHFLDWEAGDTLLLCSDGLSDKITNDELSRWMLENDSLEVIGEQLIELANERGGEDNISLIIIRHDFDAKEGDTSC